MTSQEIQDGGIVFSHNSAADCPISAKFWRGISSILRISAVRQMSQMLASTKGLFLVTGFQMAVLKGPV